MNVTSDSYFCIGTHHIGMGMPCQDYALSCTIRDNIHLAIVSDGCSDTPYSDIGARYVAHWFRSFMDYGVNIPTDPRDFPFAFKEEMIDDFQHAFDSHDDILKQEYLDATLVAAIVDQRQRYGFIIMAGDGAFTLKYKDGKMETFNVNVDTSMPPYLSYSLNKNRARAFKAHDGIISVMRFDHTRKIVDLVDSGPVRDTIFSGFPVFSFDTEEVEMVTVFTDGLSSFQRSFGEIAEYLTDVKTWPGRFVARTCMGNLKRMAKDGLTHYDDVAIAALKFGNEKTSSSTDPHFKAMEQPEGYQ